MFFRVTIGANQLKIIQFIILPISILVVYVQNLTFIIAASFTLSASNFNQSCSDGLFANYTRVLFEYGFAVAIQTTKDISFAVRQILHSMFGFLLYASIRILYRGAKWISRKIL